tara:strand:+ start:2326 stop:2994 length:669 start_codon:yes stop_codon:yes gene_type:complete
MDPIDSLVYSKHLRKPKGEITLFAEAAKYIKLPPPPENSSQDTAKDLLTVQGATYLLRDGMKKSIKKHDRDPAFSIKLYMSLFGLAYDLDYINKVLTESAILIREHKNLFNRPRPKQLSPYFGIDFDTYSSRTMRTPSYPSGHTTQSRLIAEIYGAKYPEHKANLLKAAEECGGGRIMGGLHYPTDHKAGVYLAKRLFKSLKRDKATTYDQSIDLTTKKGKK